jgi:Protein of unknown function (DUF4238)
VDGAMSETKSQITHYIPEWVLWKFRHPRLYELDIFNAKTELRAPKKAGSGRDLWPNDIEDRLSIHDNVAAQIYRNQIEGKDKISLTDTERMQFANWLAYFYVRSPKRLVNVQAFLAQENYNREGLVADLYGDRAASIERIKSQNPQAYAETVAELGKDHADERILAYYAHAIRTAPESSFEKSDVIRHEYMRTAETNKYAEILLKYDWVWLRTSREFVIGDDPLVSWHLASSRWEYGIALPGVEITMPLTLKLSLCLQQQPIRNKSDIHPHQ